MSELFKIPKEDTVSPVSEIYRPLSTNCSILRHNNKWNF